MPHRPPKTLLYYGELRQGKSSHGGQTKRFKDALKTSMKAFSVNLDTWGTNCCGSKPHGATLSTKMPVYVKKGGGTAAAPQKRQARKGKPAPAINHIACLFCHRTFRARIGLISHHRRVHTMVSPPLEPKMTDVVLVNTTDEQHFAGSQWPGVVEYFGSRINRNRFPKILGYFGTIPIYPAPGGRIFGNLQDISEPPSSLCDTQYLTLHNQRKQTNE